MVKTALDELKDEVEMLKKTVTELGEETVRVGTIMPYGGSTAPNDGWLFCNGRALRRDEYPDLYSVIGANFGAPDTEQFNLPDLRGRFVRGVDHGAGMDPDAEKRTADKSGGNAGEKVGSVQGDELKSHAHMIKAKHASEIGGSSDRDPPAVAGWSNHPTDKPRVEAFGGNETRPKNIYVNWIIYAGKKKSKEG